MIRSISTRNKVAIAALLLSGSGALAAGLSGSMTPQIGGNLGSGFDGGLSGQAQVSTPTIPCSQTGLIFTSGCNAILYVVLY